MGEQELSAPPPPPPPSEADMTAEQKLYWLNALQVVDDWSVHDDGDGRLFYYDRKTDASQWEVPEDLASLETEFMMKLMLQNAVAHSSVWTAHDAGNGTLYYFNSKTRESAWERPSEWGAAEAAAAAEAREQEVIAEVAKREKEEKDKKKKERAAKKKHKKHKKHKEKQEGQAEQKEKEETKEEEPVLEEKEEEEPITAEELQAEQERIAREQKRIEHFRALLRDKSIMPFCKWSVALPQIAGDPRFMGVPTMVERRAIFDHFVEHRREDLKAEKKNKLKQAKQVFTQLLREQFQQDYWEPNTTLSVFLSTLENHLESERYTQVQDEAMTLLTLSAQEKMYAKAVAEYKSEALKRDGEQLRLTKFLEDKLAVNLDTSTMSWESDEAQKLVREFYSSAATSGEPAALLPEQNQKEVFDEVVARLTRGRPLALERQDERRLERSHSRRHSPPRECSESRDHKQRDPSPRRDSRHSHHEHRRSRSHSRRRRNRSDSRSQSRGRESKHRSRNSSRRRSPSSSRSRSRSREERSARGSSSHHRPRSRTRWS